jgi:hypothetical protein
MKQHSRSPRTTKGAVPSLVAFFVLALLLSTHLRAQAEPDSALDGRWHFRIVPFFWATSIEGRASVGGVPEVPLKVSFSQIIDKFDFGKLGRFEARRNRLGLGVDVIYLDLGADVDEPALGLVGVTADVRQLIAEAFGFYRAAIGGRAEAGYVDLLAGLRFTDTQKKLTDPDGTELPGTALGLNWLDAMAGARFRLPLSARVGLRGRADVAGFGSDLTWNAHSGFDLALARRWAVAVEYRWLDINYDAGQLLQRDLFDVRYSGPYVWFSYSW